MTFRFGRRGADFGITLNPRPFSFGLADTGHRMAMNGCDYVVLRDVDTQRFYARPIHAVEPSLVRVFPTD